MDPATQLDAAGWLRFAYEQGVADWAARARQAGLAAVTDPSLARWHVCEGTWFIGVDALPNAPDGAVAGSEPLGGAALALARARFGALPLHPAQVSVVWPGYPRPRAGESAGAFRYRRNRDAAHVDGLRASGPERRRRIDECHAFILGLALNPAPEGAAPLVVWEGSHHVIRRHLHAALAPHDPAEWGHVDVTDAYNAARRAVFETCRRVPLPAQPGEAVLLHRLALHGVAPWTAGAAPEGRMVAYFRPELPGGVQGWLTRP